MADHARELKSVADDIQTYARRIRNDPKNDSAESWARKIVSLADDIESLARKIERG